MYPRLASTTKFTPLTTSQCELHVDGHGGGSALKLDDTKVEFKTNFPLSQSYISLDKIQEYADQDVEVNLLVLVGKIHCPFIPI